MKKKFIDIIVVISCIIILIQLIYRKTLIFSTIGYSMELWVKNIIPSLFPFFIISDILINFQITDYIPRFIKHIFKYLFNISEYGVSIFFLSMLSGFPSNARNTRKYFDAGLISLEEANHILTFTHFSNPIFILSTIAVLFLKNEKLGFPILISHYLGNIIIGMLSRNYSHIPVCSNYTKVEKKSQNFGLVLTKSISSAIDSLLLILGTLTCFLVLSSLIIESFNVNIYNGTIIKCILEITMGLKSLSLLSINEIYQVVIATMAVSFGGLSVHMQVISQISDTEITYFPFFISRFYHAVISGILSLFFYFILYN